MISLVVVETVPTFDPLLQSLNESCCWSAINDIVIHADHHAQVFADETPRWRKRYRRETHL